MKLFVKALGVAVVVITMAILGGCGKKATPAPERPKIQQGEKRNKSGVKKDVDKEIASIELSRGVGEVPWTNKKALEDAIKANKAYTLMAVYKASLPDPILNERHNIALGADYICGSIVQPSQIFSLNQRIGWRSLKRGFLDGPMYSGNKIVPTVGGGICKVASVMYNAVVLANQKVVERHPHSMTVPYVPPGQDATISFGSKDLKFKNITKHSMLIWSENIGDTLYIAFYGSDKPPAVKWHHKTLSKTKTWTRRINDPSLPKGSEKVIYEGSDGITVHSWITILYPNNKKVEKDMGISAYRPGPRVIAVGTGVDKASR